MKPGDRMQFYFCAKVHDGRILAAAVRHDLPAWEISWEGGVITLTERELEERLANVHRCTLDCKMAEKIPV
jgi:hypothetical protein